MSILSNYVTSRNGIDSSRSDLYLKGSEFVFRENTFFTGQISGEHTLAKPVTLKWYGAFNILDGYIPDQRRLLYSRMDPARSLPCRDCKFTFTTKRKPDLSKPERLYLYRRW